MADGSGAPISGTPAHTSGSPHEFGTLWIQDQHGVSQMIRVVQASPSRLPATAVVATPGSSVSLPSNSSGGASGVVRAIIKTGGPAGAVPTTGSSTGTSHVMRRTVQVHPSAIQIARPANRAVLGSATRPQLVTLSPNRTIVQQNSVTGSPVRRAILARRLPLTPKRRVLPSNRNLDTSTSASTPNPAMASAPAASAPVVSPPTLASVLAAQMAAATPPRRKPPLPHQQQQLLQEMMPNPTSAAARAAFVSPILDHTGARKRQSESDPWSDVKRGRPAKNNKGLRHFSMKVCEKVRTKGTTTYNEVADELVTEFTEESNCDSPSESLGDQKNIRRRVYDALNVLMAMNIISKERKEIRWLGLPTNSLQECRTLQREKAQRMHRINLKTQQLKDLILQQIAFKNLVERNRKAEAEHGPPPENSTVQLPFIIVNTSKKTVIDCSISSDKMEYLFSFDDTFEIHDDIEVLKRMGLALGLDNGTSREEDVARAKEMVPPSLAPYIDQLSGDASGGGGDRSADLEAELNARGGSGTASNSERAESGTPSIDFDSDDEEDNLLEVDYDGDDE